MTKLDHMVRQFAQPGTIRFWLLKGASLTLLAIMWFLALCCTISILIILHVITRPAVDWILKL